MKKILAATLFALISTTAIANDSVTTANLASKKGSTFGWKIDDTSRLVVVDNLTDSNVKLLVRVDAGDKVSALCGGKSDDLMPGAAMLCTLFPGANLQLTIFAGSFRNGSQGTYTFIK